ncbi:MAG: BatA domain-containing protein [Bryobacteraceae bacterium]|nr:BatA domain-containing protein [Bryobacteraceae bacterium]MDW8376905.1 BatA domain-containing protein [Bryobacterales bacterium]
MGFLAPWFLVGLATLGLPVWLHLLRQHKTTPKHFSSLMFFERRTQSSIKHRRLKYLLLLAARLLLLLLLVLAFASPFIRTSTPVAASSNSLLVLTIDNSYSMRADKRLERAKQQAASVLASRAPRQQAQVLAIGATATALTQPTVEGNELKAAVESIQPGDSRSSYGELARLLRSLEQTSRQPLEVHFFSDMQKTSLPPAFVDLRLGDATRLILHSVAEQTQANYAVENVTAPRSVFDPKKARIQAVIAAYQAPAAQRTVSLLINGRLLGSKTVDIPENGRATVEFLGLDANYGFNRGEVKLDGGPADALAGDDSFFFAVERADPRRVLFVHEARGQRSLLYFRAALEAAAEGAFLIDSVTSESATGIDLSKYGFVVLSDTGNLAPAFEKTLRDYVRAGGGLFIAAGPSMAARQKVPVFEESVKESRYAARAAERFLVAGSMDVNHPALRAGRWDNVKFYQAIRVEPGQARTLARLSDDTPLLLEKRLGEGRILLLTSTLDNISNDFPLHACFVPFVEQAGRYLTGSEVRPASYLVDSYVELRSEQGASTVEVLDPRGKRALSLEQAARARSFPLTEIGFYDIARANGRHELVAVNADRKESDLELAPRETLELWQGTGAQPPPAAGPSAGQTTKHQTNLWWYVLVAAVLVALLESLLASQHLSFNKESA